MEQSYKNHQQRVPIWTFGVLLPFTMNFVWAFARIAGDATTETVMNLIVSTALLLMWWMTRRMVLTVQDRVIRLEMRLRLREVLPPGMHAEIPRLTVGQLVALRFASDAELPELTKEVLAGRFATPKDIKMNVRAWQGDYLRA